MNRLFFFAGVVVLLSACATNQLDPVSTKEPGVSHFNDASVNNISDTSGLEDTDSGLEDTDSIGSGFVVNILNGSSLFLWEYFDATVIEDDCYDDLREFAPGYFVTSSGSVCVLVIGNPVNQLNIIDGVDDSLEILGCGYSRYQSNAYFHNILLENVDGDDVFKCIIDQYDGFGNFVRFGDDVYYGTHVIDVVHVNDIHSVLCPAKYAGMMFQSCVNDGEYLYQGMLHKDLLLQ